MDAVSEPRPLPPRLDPRDRPAVRRTRRIGTVVRTVAAALSVLLLVGSGWVWYLRGTAEQNLTRLDALPAAGNSDAPGADGRSTNILLVGSDSRAGASQQELRDKLRTGDPGTMNTDTMLVVHLPSNGTSASVVSFPRDSYVEVPGFGQHKLNSAYALGYNSLDDGASEAVRDSAGAQTLVQTISSLSGLQIDNYVQVDLIGFYNLTEVIGGVEVNLCAAAKEPDSGIDLPAGVQTISGADALAFVRQRQGLPNGDLDRIVRQQAFIGAVVRKLLSAGVLLNPLKQRDLVEAAANSLIVDSDLDLLDLAQRLQYLAAGNVKFSTVPIANPDGNVDGSSVVLLADPDVIAAYFQSLSAPPDPPADTATVDPAEVTVEVYNGSGVSGQGGDAQTALEELGYAVASVGNADRSDYTTTEIRYAAGLDAQARTLARVVPGARLVEVDTLDGQVQLVIGSDFAGIGRPTAAPAEDPPSGAQDQPRTAADTACIN